ncbi:hypothetical protein M422DRAFT_249562 [Sphaerobolus stellatus SS14]|uniref:Uncharacterized protein n=1 Tax=Sphaerobolus stellatus (strain SS14) TaxID=990650 RepID=A0A0C9UUS0_SPHS4|nr:hypothetical protein M422DRAFT_249562 [Sphaerobolus stellatus SS14]
MNPPHFPIASGSGGGDDPFILNQPQPPPPESSAEALNRIHNQVANIHQQAPPVNHQLLSQVPLGQAAIADLRQRASEISVAAQINAPGSRRTTNTRAIPNQGALARAPNQP